MSDDLTRTKLDTITNQQRKTTDKVVSSITSFEARHEAYMVKSYGRFCEQFELYHATAVGIFHNLNYSEPNLLSGYRSIQFMIAVNSQKSLYSAYKLLKIGMYDDAVAILRIVYESFLRITFISLNQEHPYNAIIRKPGEGARFDATGLVNEQLKLNWKHYSILSNFAHGNSYRIFLDMEANADLDNPQAITVRYKIDEKMIGLCTNYFYFLTLTNLWLAIEQFKPSDHFLAKNIEFKKLFNIAVECKELAFNVLASHTDGEHWRGVAADLSHIFELIAITSKETNRDWKAKWQDITSS